MNLEWITKNDHNVWTEINNAVVQEMGKIRIAQKVFPTKPPSEFTTDPTEIPDDQISFDTFTISEGKTKPFVEIYRDFSLTTAQVSKEPEMNTCKTLARMAAKEIALAEDSIIFRGTNYVLDKKGVKAEQQQSAGTGLLGIALEQKQKVSVHTVTTPRPNGVIYGENLFRAVTDGITLLTSNVQAPNYALILPTIAYADSYVSPNEGSLITTAERIKPLVEGGFYGTGTLPQDQGLLVALGGDPTNLYLPLEGTTEYVRKEGAQYFFRVVERIQFVIRDARALVLLEIDKPPASSAPLAK